MRTIRLGLKDIFAPANDEAIIQSFLDTDYYKFPMAYFIWKYPEYRDVEVTFELIIRDKKIRPMEVIPEAALREQLNACRELVITQAECSFVGGMTLSDDKTHIIPGDFLADLRKMRLPEFNLEVGHGELRLYFTGTWWKVTWWEIFGMPVVTELLYYYLIKNSHLSDFEIATIYAGMLKKMQDKIRILRTEPGVKFALFDTRRRHSRYQQSLSMDIMRYEIPDQCIGSSNVYLSMKHGSANPIGTNAHELTMVAACIAGDDIEKIRNAQYEIVTRWYETFGYDMSIMLPDTFGTVQFLNGAPAWMAQKLKGSRPDSMHQDLATDVHVKWWEKHGVDPKTKLILPSDGLDAQDMVDGYRKNGHRVGTYSFGWGTLAGNDCRGVWPRESGYEKEFFRPFSMACKVVMANGIGAVKLSDNPNKATGPKDRVELFKKIFGVEGAEKQETIV